MKRLLWVFALGSFFLFSSIGQSLGQSAPPKKTPELLVQGKKLYEQNCMPCHGPKGDLKKVFDVISKGIPNTAMVKWDQLSEQDRWALVYLVEGFATPPKKK